MLIFLGREYSTAVCAKLHNFQIYHFNLHSSYMLRNENCYRYLSHRMQIKIE